MTLHKMILLPAKPVRLLSMLQRDRRASLTQRRRSRSLWCSRSHCRAKVNSPEIPIGLPRTPPTSHIRIAFMSDPTLSLECLFPFFLSFSALPLSSGTVQWLERSFLFFLPLFSRLWQAPVPLLLDRPLRLLGLFSPAMPCESTNVVMQPPVGS